MGVPSFNRDQCVGVNLEWVYFLALFHMFLFNTPRSFTIIILNIFSYLFRISITCACSMHLALFPLDEQTCSLDVASCELFPTWSALISMSAPPTWTFVFCTVTQRCLMSIDLASPSTFANHSCFNFTRPVSNFLPVHNGSWNNLSSQKFSDIKTKGK